MSNEIQTLAVNRKLAKSIKRASFAERVKFLFLPEIDFLGSQAN